MLREISHGDLDTCKVVGSVANRFHVSDQIISAIKDYKNNMKSVPYHSRGKFLMNSDSAQWNTVSL